MSSFVDCYLPDSIRGFPFTGSPRTSTTITAVASGGEHRNINWAHPLRRFSAPEAIKCHDEIEDLKDHWLAVSVGPGFTFPFRDPLDFASVRLTKANTVPTVTLGDQTIGVGDGLTRTFQLSKTYTRGGRSYTRPIYLPVLETVLLGINALPIDTTAIGGLPGGPYTADVTRYGGEVTLDHAPAVGQVITWGGLFDNEVRFEGDDSLDLIVHAYQVDGFADLSFFEVRFCDDEVTT